jgi:mycofactocin precursor
VNYCRVMDNPTSVVGDAPTAVPEPDDTAELLVEELLVEEISIDGMCGVY